MQFFQGQFCCIAGIFYLFVGISIQGIFIEMEDAKFPVIFQQTFKKVVKVNKGLSVSFNLNYYHYGYDITTIILRF